MNTKYRERDKEPNEILRVTSSIHTTVYSKISYKTKRKSVRYARKQ